jgi:hypothetical protein
VRFGNRSRRIRSNSPGANRQWNRGAASRIREMSGQSHPPNPPCLAGLKLARSSHLRAAPDFLPAPSFVEFLFTSCSARKREALRCLIVGGDQTRLGLLVALRPHARAQLEIRPSQIEARLCCALEGSPPKRRRSRPPVPPARWWSGPFLRQFGHDAWNSPLAFPDAE